MLAKSRSSGPEIESKGGRSGGRYPSIEALANQMQTINCSCSQGIGSPYPPVYADKGFVKLLTERYCIACATVLDCVNYLTESL